MQLDLISGKIILFEGGFAFRRGLEESREEAYGSKLS